MLNRAAEIARSTALSVLTFLAVPSAGASEATPRWPTAGWTVSTPEAQGVSPAALADLVGFGDTNEMDSLLVVRHGAIVLEAHYAPFRPGWKHIVNSVTKSIVGTLFGVAHAEGRIGPLEQPVLPLFAERQVARLDANKQAMTLESLLDMTSGIDWREPLSTAVPETLLEMERSRDWVGFVLDRPMAHPPGVAFDYDSGTWQLLSAILASKTGSDPLDYARQRLFAPLGIGDVLWRRDPQGLPTGGFGLFMEPRDMARIGYLHLRGGAWEGRRLLAPSWIEKARRGSVDMRLGTSPAFRYANGWWSIPERGASMAVGFLNQLIIVLPDVDAVAVVTSRKRYAIVPLIDRLVGAMRAPGPIAADPQGSARLLERLNDASTEKASAVRPAPRLAAAISGKSWRFAPNRLRIASLALDLSPARPSYRIGLAGPGSGGVTTRAGPLGLDGLFALGEERFGVLLAVKATWLDDDRLRIVARSLLEGIVTTYTLRFDGRTVDVVFEDNRGVRAELQGESD